MKYPVARKLPSGSWTCRVRVHGQDISITRQDKKVAIAEAMAIKAGIQKASNVHERIEAKTILKAMDDYISVRQNVLSPSTIRGYRSMQRNRFKGVQHKRLCDIRPGQWQHIVNAEALTCSAKTLRNAWRFLSSVIAETTGERVKVRLPQTVVKDLPYLSPEQIGVFVHAITGTSVEIPALLALSSLRRSEILGLKWECIDFTASTISIAGSAVMNDKNQLQFKETNKNLTSHRKVPIIEPLREALARHYKPCGYVINRSPSAIFKGINKICVANHLPKVGFHGLRRSFASLAYHLRLQEEITMRIGGWSDIYTMRKIYTKISERDLADQSAAFCGYFCNIDNENDNT